MKFLKYSILALMVMVSISCTSKEDKLKNDYIEACADGNFDKARATVDKLEALDRYYSKEGKGYVNDKEIYYLLAKPSTDANQRILYLYNSYEADELPNMNDVIDVAISMGNSQLPEKLIKAGVVPTLENAKAAVSGEMPEVVDLIIAKKSELILSPEINKFYKEEMGEGRFASKLGETFKNSNSSTRKKLLELAKSENLQETSEWVKDYLNGRLKEIYSATIPTRPALGLVKSTSGGHLPDEYKRYSSAVSRYNTSIQEVITEAVSYGEIDLAKKALSNMKPNIDSKSIGDWCHVVEHQPQYNSVYDALQITENRNEIKEASKIIQSALR